MKIYNIKDKPEYIREVAELTQKEWGSKANSDKEFEEKIDKKIIKILDALEEPNYCKLILLEDNILVGFISIFPHDGEEKQELSPWYATMFVKEEYRGKGYSKILNDAILEEAKIRGFKKLYLKTDLENYYEKFGAIFIEYLKTGEKLYYFDIEIKENSMERCCVFQQNEKDVHFDYEVLKRYDWCEDAFYNESFRELVKCKECGALFIHQATAINNNYSARFIQVEDENEADYINQTANAIDFDCIERPCVCKFKGDWYFLNLEPKKQLSREETIEKIKEMTLEEKIEEWKHLYKILGDFEVYGDSTDGIEGALSVLEDIIKLCELTGGMTEPYKSEYEQLIADYKELYKIREKEEAEEFKKLKNEIQELEKELEFESIKNENIEKELEEKFKKLFPDE